MFNTVSKAESDKILAEVSGWEKVEKTSYEEHLRQHLPEEERYDIAVVTCAEDSTHEDVVVVADELKQMGDIQMMMGAYLHFDRD